MKPLQPTTVALEHRAYYLRGAPGRDLLLAATSDGRASFVLPGSVRVTQLAARSEISDVCLHPARELLAHAEEDGRVAVTGFDGKPVYERKPAVFFKGGGAACFFSEDGDYLWCAHNQAADSVRVDVYRVSDWARVGSAFAADPFGQSICSFHRTPQPGTVVFYLAAGQDGQQVFWLRRSEAELQCIPERQLRDTSSPVFSPRGDGFLVLDDKEGVRRFRFPELVETGHCRASWSGEDEFGYSLCYLDERYALASSIIDQALVLDVAAMKVVDEVVLGNHTAGHFERAGGQVVFVARRDKGTDIKGWKDDLLLVPVSAILAGLGA